MAERRQKRCQAYCNDKKLTNFVPVAHAAAHQNYQHSLQCIVCYGCVSEQHIKCLGTGRCKRSNEDSVLKKKKHFRIHVQMQSAIN